MSERIPAEAFHPSVFIKDELEARGWSISDLAMGMDGDYRTNLLALEMYLTIGPETPGLRIGDTADLSLAFGVHEDLFGNLEKSWLTWIEAKLATPATQQGEQHD